MVSREFLHEKAEEKADKKNGRGSEEIHNILKYFIDQKSVLKKQINSKKKTKKTLGVFHLSILK